MVFAFTHVNGTSRAARKVIDNGTDVVIIQGAEGGGHSGEVGTLVLLAEVLDFATVPTVADSRIPPSSTVSNAEDCGRCDVSPRSRDHTVLIEGSGKKAFADDAELLSVSLSGSE
ncbi:nitronate monooxygenase [Nocardia nova]|uniref:nitronate monooxygenase n=1 Tax=Nocardia nova TaxID=37330 RepID=UPI002157E7FB|nr:nitronate monooxygenase [Nocardia nova]